MFSLILTLCIATGGIEICQEEIMIESIDKEECLYQMEMTIQEVENSSFHQFDWMVSCSKD